MRNCIWKLITLVQSLSYDLNVCTPGTGLFCLIITSVITLAFGASRELSPHAQYKFTAKRAFLLWEGVVRKSGKANTGGASSQYLTASIKLWNSLLSFKGPLAYVVLLQQQTPTETVQRLICITHMKRSSLHFFLVETLGDLSWFGKPCFLLPSDLVVWMGLCFQPESWSGVKQKYG